MRENEVDRAIEFGVQQRYVEVKPETSLKGGFKVFFYGEVERIPREETVSWLEGGKRRDPGSLSLFL